MDRHPLTSRQAFWLAGLSAGAGYFCAVVGTGQLDVHVPALLRSVVEGVWSQEAAGWAAAVGTVAAVWVAVSASRKEHERTLQLRKDEWEREAQQQREWAGRLARAFHKELYFAHKDLELIEANLSPMSAIDDVRQYMGSDLQLEPLPLLSRFADQLNGFAQRDAAAILNVLTVWRTFTRPVSKFVVRCSDQKLRERAAKIIAHAEKVREVITDLQGRLEPYFADHEGFSFIADPARVPRD